MSDKRRSERTHREAQSTNEGFWTLARWSGGWVCPPHSMERRRRTDTAGRALARYPARRMAGSNSTSIRRHCSQPVASAVDLFFAFLDFNGSLLPSQRLIWEEVSRLPPPYRSSTPCGSFVRFAPKQLARSCEAPCIRFAAPPPIQFSKTPAKWIACLSAFGGEDWRRGGGEKARGAFARPQARRRRGGVAEFASRRISVTRTRVLARPRESARSRIVRCSTKPPRARSARHQPLVLK